MVNNYPPGVTGNEYQIAGPDYEKESDIPCPHSQEEDGGKECGAGTMEMGYGQERWLFCMREHTTDLEPLEDNWEECLSWLTPEPGEGSAWGHTGEELEGEPQ